MTDLGEQLRVSRVLAGLTQRQLAARAGTVRQTVSRYENGRALRSLYPLLAIVDAMGCDLSIGPRGRRLHVEHGVVVDGGRVLVARQADPSAGEMWAINQALDHGGRVYVRDVTNWRPLAER